MSELSNDTLKIGISLAILCHCFGLMFLTAPAPSEEDFPMTVIVKLDSAQAAVSEQGQSLGGSVSGNSSHEKKIADKNERFIYNTLKCFALHSRAEVPRAKFSRSDRYCSLQNPCQCRRNFHSSRSLQKFRK